MDIDGLEHEVNEPFQQQAAQLSDDFNLDEIAASELLLKGHQNAEALDRSPIHSATYLYHTRRKNILDAIRLVFYYLVEDNLLDEDLRNTLENAVGKLTTTGAGAQSFTERCIAAMASVRESARTLKEKEQHAQTLRMALDQGVLDDITLQRRMLRDQHDSLANIVFYLIKSKRAGIADFKRLLQVIKGLDHYDVYMAHHILPIFSFISVICGTESPISFEDTIKLHKELLQDYKENLWSLRPVQAAIFVWWLTEFNGLCNDPPTSSPNIGDLDYMSHVYTPIKAALKDGGMEFIMAIAGDVGAEYPLNSAKEELMRFLQTRVPPLEDADVLSAAFRNLLVSQLENLIESFISNMADLLKDIKTGEEEDVLMGQRTFDYELERLFLAIHFVYQGRPDAGMVFWSDPESNLNGFLTWACQRQTPFMAATFSYMVASIATGPESAAAAHKFLLDDVAPGALKKRTTYVSWEQIFKELQEYSALLESRKQKALVNTNTYNPATPSKETTDHEPELTIALDGYLRLTSQIATDCAEARKWLLEDAPTLKIMDSLLNLLNRQAAIQLWDTIFSTITALLSERSARHSYNVWLKLDGWALGPAGEQPSSSLQAAGRGPVQANFGSTGSGNLSLIVGTEAVHPAEAFARLLARLVETPVEVADLNDALPFPENLGSSTRNSGMEPYTDFILQDIFANTTIKNLPNELPVIPDKQENAQEKVLRSQYKKFRPALQLGCLQFIYTCLSSFNDDLLSMAHKGISVDDGIRATNLATYAKLHPFGRVMEHVLTEKCLNVFFEILQHGVDPILGEIEPAVPVVECVRLTISILDLAIRMQPTYFRVVRPMVRQSEGIRRKAVKSNSFDELEKAVQYSLETIVHLGMYVGARYTDVSLAAIHLLEKFNIAPDLVASTESSFGRHAPKNRVLGVVEQSPESRQIIFNFINQWEKLDSLTPSEDYYPLKLPILEFLKSTLAARPNEYTLAHMILGFGYNPKEGISMSVSPGGIGSGVSLFHAILEAAQSIQEHDDYVYKRSYCELKSACYAILSILWSSPATSSEVLYVLRANKFLFSGFLEENVINQSTLWDGAIVGTSREFVTEGVYSYMDFLGRRTALFAYTALEIRQLTVQGASTMVQNYLSTLMGTTLTPEGAIQNVQILDLLDFLELALPQSSSPPQLVFFRDCNLLVFQKEHDSGTLTFDVEMIAQLLEVKRNEIFPTGSTPEQNTAIEKEKKNVLEHLFWQNQLRLCRDAQLGCLTSWSTLVSVMLEDCDMHGIQKTSFILQALQAILPKLEAYSMEDVESALHLSSLANALISHVSFDVSTLGDGRGSDLANDRLYQLFRVSLRCIQSPVGNPRLREDFYSVCLRYLNGMASVNGRSLDARRHNTKTIKASGEKLLEVICNDAYSGEGQCKVVSLLLLEALAALAAEDNSTYIIDGLARQNFLVVLIDSIKTIVWDLQNTPPEGKFPETAD